MSIKRAIRLLWIVLLFGCLVLYNLYGAHLTEFAITDWMERHRNWIILMYCFLCTIRGLFMLPATPFVFAGIAVFPNQPVLLLLVTFVCILTSSILIYHIARYMNFLFVVEKKYPGRISSIHARLKRSTAFLFIAGWAVLPFTPTDLLIYVAGSLKMPVWKVIFPVMVGEEIICAIYIFNGMHLIDVITQS